MIVAIHQPNFFPWLGYFDKILRSDYFVFLDDVQYTRGTMMNRTFIKNNNVISYLTCPVHFKHGDKIRDVTITEQPWKEKAIRTIKTSYQHQPFNLYLDEVVNMILRDENNLSSYNIQNILHTCKLFDIHPKKGFVIQSELGVFDRHKTDLIIDIVNTLGGDMYYSGIGAMGYHNEETLEESGITVIYQDTRNLPRTSIIDVMLTNECPSLRFNSLPTI